MDDRVERALKVYVSLDGKSARVNQDIIREHHVDEIADVN